MESKIRLLAFHPERVTKARFSLREKRAPWLCRGTASLFRCYLLRGGNEKSSEITSRGTRRSHGRHLLGVRWDKRLAVITSRINFARMHDLSIEHNPLGVIRNSHTVWKMANLSRFACWLPTKFNKRLRSWTSSLLLDSSFYWLRVFAAKRRLYAKPIGKQVK